MFRLAFFFLLLLRGILFDVSLRLILISFIFCPSLLLLFSVLFVVTLFSSFNLRRIRIVWTVCFFFVRRIFLLPGILRVHEGRLVLQHIEEIRWTVDTYRQLFAFNPWSFGRRRGISMVRSWSHPGSRLASCSPHAVSFFFQSQAAPFLV